MSNPSNPNSALSATGKNPDSPVRPSVLSRRGWIHFGLAAGVLLVASAGWNIAMVRWKWVLAKKPVPSPEHVRKDNCRVTNFPEKIGPYVLAQDGEFSERLDGKPDGQVILSDDLLETLGTKAHPENWYFIGKYRVPDPSKAGGVRYISLSITYYTGLLDGVPHITDVCMEAAGATPVPGGSGQIVITDPNAPEPWKKVRIKRAAFIKNDRKIRQYYFLSANGLPTDDWKVIRGKFMLPWVRYCFFAKIQVEVLTPQDDISVSDSLCRDFLTHTLPVVLKFLPTADDVKKLEQGDGS